MILLTVILMALSIAVLGAVLSPLVLHRRARPRGDFDKAVYRDQLAEVERDLGRGVIEPAEAGSARLEIERRLLAAASVEEDATLPGRQRIRLAAVIGIIILAWAVGIYLELGAPGAPDTPFAARAPEPGANPGHQDAETAAQHLEQALAKNTGDVDSWMLLARTDSELGHWDKAAEAYRHALPLLPEEMRPGVEAAYGEALTIAAQGIVTPAASDAFVNALEGQPTNRIARYYLASADAQAGKLKQAIDAWLKLAGDLTADSEMRAEIEKRVVAASQGAGINPPPSLPPPAAATSTDDKPQPAMSPAEQDKMIHGMVAKLEAELEAKPDDADGWMRLGRSYVVLGESEKSAAAYDRAAKLRPNDAQVQLDEIEALMQGHNDTDPLPARAIALLERVKALDPNRPEALWLLGYAAAQAHRDDEARAYWTKLVTVLPQGSAARDTVDAALAALGKK